MPVLIPERTQAAARPLGVHHVHSAGVDDAKRIVKRHTDGQISETIAVEVAACDAGSGSDWRAMILSANSLALGRVLLAWVGPVFITLRRWRQRLVSLTVGRMLEAECQQQSNRDDRPTRNVAIVEVQHGAPFVFAGPCGSLLWATWEGSGEKPNAKCSLSQPLHVFAALPA